MALASVLPPVSLGRESVEKAVWKTQSDSRERRGKEDDKRGKRGHRDFRTYGWYGGRKAPSIVYKGKDGSLKNGGFVFYPGGEVCFWQGDFRSNFRWSGIKQTD